jgi:mono/diheme cytochrome c family protein
MADNGSHRTRWTLPRLDLDLDIAAGRGPGSVAGNRPAANHAGDRAWEKVMLRAVLPLAVILLAAAQASAQVPSGDATAGRELVKAQCSTCHDGEGSPRGRQQGPSLASVASMPSTTSISLHAFLMTPHVNMPNYRLTPQEIDDVVTYILSLRRR